MNKKYVKGRAAQVTITHYVKSTFLNPEGGFLSCQTIIENLRMECNGTQT